MPINPAALAATLPGNNYKLDGGLGGYVSGMQIADYMANMPRAQRDSDLEYDAKKNELDNAMLDNPVKELTRQLSMSKMGAEQDLLNTGKPQEAMRLKVENEIEKVHAERGTRGVKELQDQADLFWEGKNKIDSGLMDEKSWQDFVNRGKKVGLNLPPVMTPDVQQQIRKHGEVAAVTREMAGRRVVQSMHEQWQSGENRSRERSALEVARARAAATGSRGSADNAFVRAVDESDIIEPSDIPRYAVAMANKQKGALSAVMQSSMKRELITEWNAERDPKKRAAMGPSAIEYAEKKIQVMLHQDVVDTTLRSLQGKTLKMPDGTTRVIDENAKPLIEQLVKGVPTNATPTQGKSPQGSPAPKGSDQAPQGKAAGPEKVDIYKDPDMGKIVSVLKTKDPAVIREAINKTKDMNPTVRAKMLKLLDLAEGKTSTTMPGSQAAAPAGPSMMEQYLLDAARKHNQVGPQVPPIEPPTIMSPEGM